MDTSRTNRETSWIDTAFAVPQEFADDPFLAAIYAGMVSDMRTEARGITMYTPQSLLIERIAYNYTALRKAQQEGPIQMEKLNKAWLDMTAEFHKQLASGHAKIRESLLLQISDMVLNVVSNVKDAETKKNLVLALKEGFAEMGL
jgi:hypothetical protein